MELDLSQVGQNIASTNSISQLERPLQRLVDDAEQQPLSESAETMAADKDQVFQFNADISEEFIDTSVKLDEALAEISDFVQTQNRDLAFSVDEKSQKPVVVVTDSDSGDIIRQIPSEEALALAERIKELQTDVGSAVGVLFNKQV